MLSFISKIFGSKSDRDLKDIRPLVDEIHAATSKIQSLSNDQLRQKTIEFKRKTLKHIRTSMNTHEHQYADIRVFVYIHIYICVLRLPVSCRLVTVG